MLWFWIVLLAIGIMAFFPETPTARWLQRWLVEKPAALIAELAQPKTLRWIVLLPVLALLLIAAPELLLVLAAIGDVGLVLEVLLAIWAAVVSGNVKGAWKRLLTFAAEIMRLVHGASVTRSRGARRKRRPSEKKPPSSGDSADEPGVGWAFA